MVLTDLVNSGVSGVFDWHPTQIIIEIEFLFVSNCKMEVCKLLVDVLLWVYGLLDEYLYLTVL